MSKPKWWKGFGARECSLVALISDWPLPAPLATHACRILPRRRPVFASVLAAELGRAGVSDGLGDLCGADVVADQQSTSILQPDLFLKSDRAHPGTCVKRIGRGLGITDEHTKSDRKTLRKNIFRRPGISVRFVTVTVRWNSRGAISGDCAKGQRATDPLRTDTQAEPAPERLDTGGRPAQPSTSPICHCDAFGRTGGSGASSEGCGLRRRVRLRSEACPGAAH